MTPKKVRWIGFLVTLSALTIPTKTFAHNHHSVSEDKFQSIENRLTKIAKTLKERETKLLESSDTEAIIDLPEDIDDLAGWLKGRRRGWIKSRRGGFLNRRGGGGFLNRRGWRDRGGFFNRRYR